MASTAETLTRLVRRWWLMVLLTALGAAAGFGYVQLSHPVYAAKAYVVVVAQNPGDTTAVSYAQAFARIAGQGDTLNAALTASNGSASMAELRRAVQTSTSPDAPVIEVTGSAGSSRHAADLANLVANGLVTTGNGHTRDTRMKLILLSAAVPPADPASPQPVLDVAVGAAMGLLLGGLALVAGAGTAGGGASQRQPAPVRREPRFTAGGGFSRAGLPGAAPAGAGPSQVPPPRFEPLSPVPTTAAPAPGGAPSHAQPIAVGSEPAPAGPAEGLERWTGRAPVAVSVPGAPPAPEQEPSNHGRRQPGEGQSES
jgi:capsular polysaccharide biosynthesis protein